MKTHQNCNSDNQHGADCYDSNNNPVRFWDQVSYILILQCSQKQPNSLANKYYMKNYISYQNPQEFLIILPTNAVIQELAMMIELLSAVLACTAMVGSFKPRATLCAYLKLRLLKTKPKLRIVNNPVNRIVSKKPNIIIQNESKYKKMQSQQDIQDRVRCDLPTDNRSTNVDNVKHYDPQVEDQSHHTKE